MCIGHFREDVMGKVINITLKLRKEISVGDEDLCVIIFTWDLSQKI